MMCKCLHLNMFYRKDQLFYNHNTSSLPTNTLPYKSYIHKNTRHWTHLHHQRQEHSPLETCQSILLQCTHRNRLRINSSSNICSCQHSTSSLLRRCHKWSNQSIYHNEPLHLSIQRMLLLQARRLSRDHTNRIWSYCWQLNKCLGLEDNLLKEHHKNHQDRRSR